MSKAREWAKQAWGAFVGLLFWGLLVAFVRGLLNYTAWIWEALG